MGRFLTVPFFLLALILAFAGAAAAALHIRVRQTLLDQEVAQAWQRLGSGLVAASRFIGDPVDPTLDPDRLAYAISDTAIQSRLEVVGSRIDSICRTTRERGSAVASIDSLRESLRRDREHLGLAIASYRGERHSLLGEWLLEGFPER